MSIKIPKAPAPGEELPACFPSEDTLRLLAHRRSTTAALLTEPGPSPEHLDDLLRLAARVPDHRQVVPFRFLVFEGKARKALGEIFAAAALAREDGSPGKARELPLRAPVVVIVVSSVNRDHKTPEWEQVMTAGAVCQNLLLAASASGYAGQWLTQWVAFDETVKERLSLADHERISGMIYLGTATEGPKERGRPEMSEIISRWPTT